MSITKPTARTLSRKINELSQLREFQKRLSVMGKGRDGDFWKSLKSNLETVAKGAQAKMDAILDETSAEPAAELANLKLYRGHKQMAENIVALVERTEDYEAENAEKIRVLEDEIRELKDLDKEGALA